MDLKEALEILDEAGKLVSRSHMFRVQTPLAKKLLQDILNVLEKAEPLREIGHFEKGVSQGTELQVLLSMLKAEIEDRRRIEQKRS